MKNKSMRALIIISILVLAAVAFVILNHFLSRVPDNPDGTLGNSAGNLNNHGLFCEYEGRIYFSNPTDNQYLYSMDLSLNDIRLEQESPVEYINIAGEHMYYYQKDHGDNVIFGVAGRNHGIYIKELKKDGFTKCYDRTASGILSLIGSDLYYQRYSTKEGFSLHKLHVDGSTKEEVSKELINPSSVYGDVILYPDTTDHFFLKGYNTSTGNSYNYNELRVYSPTLCGSYLYFINVEDNYSLYRYDFTTNTAYKLTEDRVDCFNVLGSIIFYQKNSETQPALIRMHTDGSGVEVIAEGNYTNINMTSSYTFFYDFGEDANAYYVSTTMGSTPLLFAPYATE